ncbi:MAG: hypothetical protein V2I33_25070 [Kangiellaceae bacterium]|jgi:hypothetical protein|nr:hypothetical protein [Kangiellaceae bacterium]
MENIVTTFGIEIQNRKCEQEFVRKLCDFFLELLARGNKTFEVEIEKTGLLQSLFMILFFHHKVEPLPDSVVQSINEVILKLFDLELIAKSTYENADIRAILFNDPEFV